MITILANIPSRDFGGLVYPACTRIFHQDVDGQWYSDRRGTGRLRLNNQNFGGAIGGFLSINFVCCILQIIVLKLNMKFREIIAARVGDLIVTDPLIIIKELEKDNISRFIDRECLKVMPDHAQFVWPTLFILDENNKTYPAEYDYK